MTSSDIDNINADEWVQWIEDGISRDYINYHDYDEFQNILIFDFATNKETHTLILVKIQYQISYKDINFSCIFEFHFLSAEPPQCNFDDIIWNFHLSMFQPEFQNKFDCNNHCRCLVRFDCDL